MGGGAYGGDRGLSHGSDFGGQYGYLQRGPRLDLTKPGATGPAMSTDAVLSIDINLEHTALSEMTIDIPPFDGVDAASYTDGSMAYTVDGRLLFKAEIDDVSIADDKTVTLSGTAAEEQPLTQNDYQITFEEVLTEDAIEQFCEAALPYETTVYPTPERPLSNKLVQRMDAAGDYAATLQTGDEVEDDLEVVRELPESITGLFPPAYVPTLHDTTPIQIQDDGLTSTQTTIFAEVENYVSPKSVNVDDPEASGGQATLFDNKGQTVGFNFGFVHDIPENWFDIAYRARIGQTGTEPFDRIEFKLDGQVLVEQFTTQVINYTGGYRWYVARVTYDNVLSGVDVEAGDDSHRVEITKTEGDDEIFLDCIAFRDARFGFAASLNEEVDSNGALSGPDLYPSNLPILFDAPAVGADISHIDWTVDYDEPATQGYPILVVPATGETLFAGDVYSGPDTVVLTEQHDIPDEETVTRVYGGTFIGSYSDSDRSVTPTENTESQIVEAAEMRIDGREVSVLADGREFSGTPLSILQDLHEHANRRFVIEHGVGNPADAQLDSFLTGDESLVAGDSERWIITDSSRETTDNGDANQVRVVGARAPNGQYYQGIARDEAAIARLDEETPDSDDGVRPFTVVDRSLTSDNDCLSRARTELQERSRMSIGGDIDTAPMLVEPGYPYRVRAFDSDAISDDEIGYGQNYGQYYGVGSLGVVSSLETVGYSESASDASTSLAFERPSGLFRAIEEIATADLDDRPQPARDDVPVVSSSSAFPSPPDDTDDDDGGSEPPPDSGEPPVASFTISDSTVTTGTDVTFDASGSSDPDGTIQSYEWDFGDGNTATGQIVTHAYSTDGTFSVTLTVTDDTGNLDSASDDVSVSSSSSEQIAYLSSDPLSDADYLVGGSAGPGTHGGDHVSRPAGMPTRSDADYIVSNATDFRSAINNAGRGSIIYIDNDVDISSFDGLYLPTNCKLVAGFCDPNRTENGGRGPVLYNHDSRPYNRRHLAAAGPIEVWGVSFEGPRGRFDTLEEKYFDPRDYSGPEEDFYVSALWCYPGPDAGETLIYGCEFRGWNVAGLEAGERTTPSNIRIERSTYMNNCMETLGYGVEQWNGHMDISLCYFDFNRHSISGFGYDTESYEVRDSMVGPNVISHTFDMHGLNQNLDTTSHRAGKFVDVYNCTFPFTTTDVYHGQGQEGVNVRGYPLETVEVHNNHFYHSQPPAGDGPGVEGDPWQQENISEDHFVDFNASGNNLGERLEVDKGCPLNRPIEPQE